MTIQIRLDYLVDLKEWIAKGAGFQARGAFSDIAIQELVVGLREKFGEDAEFVVLQGDSNFP